MKKTVFLILVISLTNLSLKAQNDQHLDINLKKEIIDTVLSCFGNNYVYPQVAKTLKDTILHKYKKGEYSQVTLTNDLIEQLSLDLRKIANDRHIGIKYVKESENSTSKSKHSLLSEGLEEKRRQNFNFKIAEWFPGNVGYIRFDRFEDPEYAGETVTSAVNFIHDCDAIIIDLRYNYGGEEKMVRFLSSYFFSDPTLLNSRYFTHKDSLVQSWTNSYVPGKKIIDKDVYILTSRNTASAAEAFTYILKNYNRAIIIGETTKGAAHWVEYYYFPSLNIEIKLPVARPINPVTGTNWEKTGIKPDIEIEEYKAYNKSYVIALEKLYESISDSITRQNLKWYKQIAEEKMKMELISTSNISDYCGLYEDISFVTTNNYLLWDQGEDAEFVLLPLSKDHFVFDDSNDYIIKFVRNDQDKIIGYQLLIKGRKENPVHKKTGELK